MEESPTQKTCKICGSEYPKTNEYFYIRKDGYCELVCRKCMKDKEKARRAKRAGYLKDYMHSYYMSDRENQIAYRKAYYKDHKDEMRKKQRAYREDHKSEIAEKHKEYVYLRRKEDPLYKLKMQARNNIRSSFCRKTYNKSMELRSIVGIPCDELCDYLLETFKSRYGRSWNGIENVHIDHIIPLSTAHSEEGVIKLCHYTNLQLLTAEDNLSKSNKE